MRWSRTELQEDYDNPEVFDRDTKSFESHEKYERVFQPLVGTEMLLKYGQP